MITRATYNSKDSSVYRSKFYYYNQYSGKQYQRMRPSKGRHTPEYGQSFSAHLLPQLDRIEAPGLNLH